MTSKTWTDKHRTQLQLSWKRLVGRSLAELASKQGSR